MALSFNNASKCAEIANVGGWLIDSLPETVTHPDGFWNISNLWIFCVRVDGEYTIDRYRAMELLHESGSEDRAGDLARPIVETAFPLDYLSDDAARLIDYARWQLHDVYHRLWNRISQFENISAESKKHCDDGMAKVKEILGDRFSDRRQRATWKTLEQCITFKTEVPNHDQLRHQLYTMTGVTLSRVLHNAWFRPHYAQYGMFSGRVGFVMAMDRTAKICLDNHLVGVRGTEYAKRIVELCDAEHWGD